MQCHLLEIGVDFAFFGHADGIVGRYSVVLLLDPMIATDIYVPPWLCNADSLVNCCVLGEQISVAMSANILLQFPALSEMVPLVAPAPLEVLQVRVEDFLHVLIR